jgi:hypothetical protein
MTVNGKRGRIDMVKTTTPAHTAGGWHMLTGLNGNPNAGTFPGTDLLFQSCWETSGDGTVVIGPQHGGVVAPATKHLLSVKGALVAAAGAPWIAMLVDLQGYYRLSTTNVTGTGIRTLINSNTFTASSSGGLLLTYTNNFNTLTKVRFTTSGTLPTGLALNTDYYLIRVSATTSNVAASLADAIAGTAIAYTDTGSGTHTLMIQTRAPLGVGCQALFVSQTAPSTGAPNLTASAYDSPVSTPGAGTRAFQGTPSMGVAADAYATRILHSGNATGRYGPFLPLQAGDTGVARINTFTWSGGTPYTGSGVVALAIVKPIIEIPLPITGIMTERDLRSQLVSLPQIDDGACLQWILFSTGATTNNSPFVSVLEYGWAG